MKIIRILGGYKIITCSKCRISSKRYWAYKDKLMICNSCEQLFVITSQDEIYGDFNSVIKGKQCPICNAVLKDSLEVYKVQKEICPICKINGNITETQKDIYIEAFDVFS